MPFKADKSNVPGEMLRWSLFKASREFAVAETTVGQKLAELGELAGPDECYATRQVLKALYGEIYQERLAKLKAEREHTELETAILRGDYLALVKPANESRIRAGDWPAVRENLRLVLEGDPQATPLFTL